MLQAFYAVRSERMIVEQLGYNLLFRWFVGVSIGDQHAAGHCQKHSTRCVNRDCSGAITLSVQ